MPIQSIMALPAFLLLLLAISTVVDASSNTVSITHRSHSTNYSNGLNVVKRDEETDDEYTTNFYKRVQDNKRRAMFGSMSSDEERQYSTRRNEDHSLDHYFDHRLPSSSQHNMKEGKSKLAAAESPDEPLSSSEGARSVRGGASSTATLPPRPAFWRRSSHHHGRSGRHDHHPEDDIPSSLRGNRHHGRSIEDFDDDEHCDPYGYTATDEMEDGEYQGDEDYADHHHHSALLRVPCKIAVNSGEASAGQRHHTDSSSQGMSH